MKLFRSFGGVHITGHDHGVTELLIDLPDQGVPDALAQTVRAVARVDSSTTQPARASDSEPCMTREGDTDPRPAAVTFLTTEHFVLQGARAATISESTGRASMFLSAVSGGLVALGLVATASEVGAAFYAFGLVLLPTLAFVGLVTFERVLQSGIEDFGYARRIALLRAYYFENAPELGPYLLSVPPTERLHVQGLVGGRWQPLRSVAGMVGVITAVLTGSTVAVAVILISDHSLAATLIAGAAVGVATEVALLRFQRSAWSRTATTPLTEDWDEGES
jgi:hypothetical protein